MLLMNLSACTLILLDMQLYKYLDFLYIRQKNVIPSAFLCYLRISAAHKLPTRVSYQLLQPAFTHVGNGGGLYFEVGGGGQNNCQNNGVRTILGGVRHHPKCSANFVSHLR